MDRVILHCDCNAFFASVETLFRPELKNVPMAVCGNPENRHGIILAKNEKAKAFNVQTAETIWQAKKKCPNLVLVSPHHGEYARISKLVNEIYHRYTDYIEPFGIDESWLDVTNSVKIFGDGKEIADRIRQDVMEEIGITISVGVSFNKIFAKLGSDYKKPNATTVIDRENFKDILYSLPASTLLFVGHSTEKSLKLLGINTIGELATCDIGLLEKNLGKVGEMLHRYANGEDTSEVAVYNDHQKVKSVSNGMTFSRDLLSESDVRIAVTALSDTVASRMRKYGAKCTTVSVTLKNPNFRSVSKQMALKVPTNTADVLHDCVLDLIGSLQGFNKPIRTLTIAGSNLIFEGEECVQMSLFSNEDTENRKNDVETAMDEIRKKYGKGSIKFGSVIQNDLGID